jgi:hypothetical protein
MVAEIWKPILDHDGYEVSNLGRVRSLDRFINCPPSVLGPSRRLRRGRILKLSMSGNGYLHVSLGRSFNVDVHTLVLRAFVGPPPDGFEGDHRNTVRRNNRLTNLRYWPIGKNRSEGAKRCRNRP